MAYSRANVPELENLLKYGKKKFVRYDEGAKLYSMGLHYVLYGKGAYYYDLP